MLELTVVGQKGEVPEGERQKQGRQKGEVPEGEC